MKTQLLGTNKSYLHSMMCQLKKNLETRVFGISVAWTCSWHCWLCVCVWLALCYCCVRAKASRGCSIWFLVHTKYRSGASCDCLASWGNQLADPFAWLITGPLLCFLYGCQSVQDTLQARTCMLAWCRRAQAECTCWIQCLQVCHGFFAELGDDIHKGSNVGCDCFSF